MLARRATLLPSASRTAVCSRNSRSRIRQRGSRISSPGSRGTPGAMPIRLPWPWKATTATPGRCQERPDRLGQDPGAVPASRSPANGSRCAAGSHGPPCRERHPQAPVAAPAMSPMGRARCSADWSRRRSTPTSRSGTDPRVRTTPSRRLTSPTIRIAISISVPAPRSSRPPGEFMTAARSSTSPSAATVPSVRSSPDGNRGL